MAGTRRRALPFGVKLLAVRHGSGSLTGSVDDGTLSSLMAEVFDPALRRAVCEAPFLGDDPEGAAVAVVQHAGSGSQQQKIPPA